MCCAVGFSKDIVKLWSYQSYRDWDNISFKWILSDGEFLLTDPRSAKTLDKVVEKFQKCSIFDP